MKSPLDNSPNGQMLIIVPLQNEQTMLNRGFAAEPCPDDPQGLSQFKAQVCVLADAHPSVHEQFFKSFGVTPAEVCSFATAALPAD